MVGSCYVMLDTLLNPILSDHFGFTVADNSYFMFGILAMQMGGSILLYVVLICLPWKLQVVIHRHRGWSGWSTFDWTTFSPL